MMPSHPTRTRTTDLTTFTRPLPSSVTYDLTTPNTTLITVPPSSAWTSGLHWHETHTEYLSIIQGRALVTLGKATWIHSPTDGIIEVKRGMVHEWRRVPGGDNEDGNLVVKEWTDPEDGQKEVFFRMLNSFLMEPQPAKLHTCPLPLVGGWLEPFVVALQLFLIFRTCDNWPVMIGQQGALGWALTHMALSLASIVGRSILGLRSLYDEYVSVELQSRVSMANESRKEKHK